MTTPSPVRIVFCITSLETGGAERSLVDLVTRLAPDRFAPVVVSLAPCPALHDQALVRELQAAGIDVEFLNVRSKMQAPVLIWRLERLLKTYRPRILQAFLFHANVAGAVAGRLAGVPHVVAGIRVAERRANLHRWLARCTLRWVRCHVCVSQSVARFSQHVAGLPAERLVVIPNGVDPDRYPASAPARLTDLGIPPGRRAVLYAGRLSRQKRVDWLLRRAAEFLPRLPAHDLLLVGRGCERRRLEELAVRLRIDDRVHFAGWRSDVVDIMAASDLVVLSSYWEGMPRVVLEAMASAKPVVATAVEGVPELLGEDARGQLVPINDAGRFSTAVVSIAGDRRLAAELGHDNRRRAATMFSVDQTVAAYVRLYESLLDAEPAEPSARSDDRAPV